MSDASAHHILIPGPNLNTNTGISRQKEMVDKLTTNRTEFISNIYTIHGGLVIVIY